MKTVSLAETLNGTLMGHSQLFCLFHYVMLTAPHVHKLFLCIGHQALWVESVFFFNKGKVQSGKSGCRVASLSFQVSQWVWGGSGCRLVLLYDLTQLTERFLALPLSMLDRRCLRSAVAYQNYLPIIAEHIGHYQILFLHVIYTHFTSTGLQQKAVCQAAFWQKVYRAFQQKVLCDRKSLL